MSSSRNREENIHFCPDSLWDNNVTWNTSNPNLTTCFREVILATVPGILLLIGIPFWIRHLCKKNFEAIFPSGNRRRSKLLWIKIFLSLTVLSGVAAEAWTLLNQSGKTWFYSHIIFLVSQ